MHPVNIPGFEITSVLCSNKTSLVLRGLALPERKPVVLKLLRIPGVEGPITFSGGVVMRHPGERPNEVLKRVDRLLYQAKEAGRNQVLKEGYFYESGLRNN